MTDSFVLLDEPRRPWLDPEVLKTKFLARSAEVHPDRVHGESDARKQVAQQRFAELNTAYNRLREPKDRLRVLIELETGSPPKDIQRLPSGTMDLFVEVGQICRDVDGFLAERAKVTSPVLQVQLFERAQGWTERLTTLQRKTNATRDDLSAELQSLNARWDAAPAIGSAARTGSLPLERLDQIYRVLSYVARWSGQLQERLVQLSF